MDFFPGCCTMKTRVRLAACAMVVALTTPAWADVGRNEAAAVAQRATGGRVLSVDRAETGRRPVWRVKVVTPQGDVRVMLIDVATGRPG
jgi:hypothetical protein